VSTESLTSGLRKQVAMKLVARSETMEISEAIHQIISEA